MQHPRHRRRAARHASLDSIRIYTLPTDDGLDAAIARLTVDR
jgi:hypothetical protein